MPKKTTTYTATTTQEFDIGNQHIALVKGEEAPPMDDNAREILLTNGHITDADAPEAEDADADADA